MLRLAGRDPLRLLYAVAAAVLLRWSILEVFGQVRDLAYYTIFGRIDQFLLGILVAVHFRNAKVPAPTFAITGLLFILGYWSLTTIGAIDVMSSNEENTLSGFQTIWVVIPTVEGMFCALLIAFYEKVAMRIPRSVDRVLNAVGTCSYSIYLLHPLLVVVAARIVHSFVYAGSDYYVLTALGSIVFVAVLPVMWASFRLVEEPFLRFRLQYAFNPNPTRRSVPAPSAVAGLGPQP